MPTIKAKGQMSDLSKKEIPPLTIENAKIVYRNFSGKPGRFNPEGKRNFCVIIDNALAPDLQKIGWNIKYLKPRNENEDPQAYLQVAVGFKFYPPKIMMITQNGKTLVTEANVSLLDFADVSNVNVIIRGRPWEVNGGTGVKAYVKTMYVELVEDEFEARYRDVPDSALSSIENGDD